MEYGLQLYSVRDLAQKNMEEALRKVADIGYKLVETAGFFGQTAEVMREILERYGLKISGTHTPLHELTDHYEETLAYHKVIGNKNIIIPMEDLSSQQKLDTFVDAVNLYQKRLEAEGICLCYHNHYHEFFTNPDGSDIYEQITKRTQLFLELDTGWAYSAMQNPVELMEKFQERIRFIHIRDCVTFPAPEPGLPMGELYKQIGQADIGRPLGKGTAPVWDVYKKAIEMEIPLIVESESMKPDGISEVTVCYEELKRMEG